MDPALRDTLWLVFLVLLFFICLITVSWCGYYFHYRRILGPVPAPIPVPIPSPVSSAHGSQNSGQTDPLGRMTVSSASTPVEPEDAGADEAQELEEPAGDAEFSDVDMEEPYNRLNDPYAIYGTATI